MRSPDTWTISERNSESDDILAAIATGIPLTRRLLKRAGPDTPLSWLNENKLQHLTSTAVRLKPDRSLRQALRVMAQIRQGRRDSQCQIKVFANAEPPGPSEADEAFAAGAYPLNGGITMLTDRRDPLDYSGFQSLRIFSFDLLTSDDEDRWHAQAFTGQAELIAAMAHPMAQRPERLSWHVIGGQERFGIRRRLELLH